MAENKRPETPETDISPPEIPPLKATDTRPFDDGRIQYADEVPHAEDHEPENRPSSPHRLPSPPDPDTAGHDIEVEGP